MKKQYSQLYQYSTIASVSAGNYDGSINFGELLEHGDFGLGTFDHADGELVVLDNEAYQLKADGSVNQVKSEWTTPFASLCFFKSDQKFSFNQTLNLEELEEIITKRLPSKNIFYAIKVTGHFDEISTRTIVYQSKPYVPLIKAIKNQEVTKLTNLCGNLVGFYTPKFANSIQVHRYHFHFLDEDRETGGHVFNFKLVNPVVEISYLFTMTLNLPSNEAYLKSNMDNENLQNDLRVAEHNRG